MNTSEPAPDPNRDVRRWIRAFERGLYTEGEWLVRLAETVTEENVELWVSLMPPKVRARVKHYVDRAPRTEIEWSQSFRISGVVYRRPPECKTEEDLARWYRERQAQEDARFRRGIEALRRHLEGG